VNRLQLVKAKLARGGGGLQPLKFILGYLEPGAGWVQVYPKAFFDRSPLRALSKPKPLFHTRDYFCAVNLFSQGPRVIRADCGNPQALLCFGYHATGCRRQLMQGCVEIQ